jgi:hypothetical protein
MARDYLLSTAHAVRTVWIVKAEEEAPRFVTAFPR